MAFTSNFIDADTACRWGLINRVVPAAELLPAATALAAEMAGIDPDMIQAYKALIDQGYAQSLGAGLDCEQRASAARNARISASAVKQRRRAVIERGRSQTR